MPWEQTENEIRHQVRDPADFQTDSFKTITLKGNRPRVFAVIGKLHDATKTTVQSLRFPLSDGWTVDKAKEWTNRHFKETTMNTTEIIRLGGTTERVNLHYQRLAAQFQGAIDRENRTATLVFYSGAPVRAKLFGIEHVLIFSMQPAHVKLDRLNAGANLLDRFLPRRL